MHTRTKLLLAALGVASAGAAFGGIAASADPTDTVKDPYAQAADWRSEIYRPLGRRGCQLVIS